MGVVFLGFDEGLQRLAAIKVMNPELASNPIAVERLKTEAQAVARLNHPNIVSVYAFGQDPNGLFIAFEYVDGSDLRTVLAERGPFPVEQALEITRQAAVALRFAFANHILHRDIKPGNLLVLKDGTIKVADFGLAKRLDVDHALTTTDSIVGSPSYMAPEQGMGEKVDFRADIYSLGCTLFAMLTGKAPYHAETPLAVMMQHAQAEIPEPEEVSELLDGGVMRLLKRMLAKKRDDRYASYDELIAELDNLLAVCRGASPAPVAKPSAPIPWKTIAYACAGLGGILMIGIVALAVFNGRDPRPIDPIEPITQAASGQTALNSNTDPSATPTPLPTAAPPPPTDAPPSLDDQQIAMANNTPINRAAPILNAITEIRETGEFLQDASEVANYVVDLNWIAAKTELELVAQRRNLSGDDAVIAREMIDRLQKLDDLEKRTMKYWSTQVPFEMTLLKGIDIKVLEINDKTMKFQVGDEEPIVRDFQVGIPPMERGRIIELAALKVPPKSLEDQFNCVLYMDITGHRDVSRYWTSFKSQLVDQPELLDKYEAEWDRWTALRGLASIQNAFPRPGGGMNQPGGRMPPMPPRFQPGGRRN